MNPSAVTSLCVLVSPARRQHLGGKAQDLAMEIGLYSFAENTPDLLIGGSLQSPAERLKDLLEEIELADQLGLDFYGQGEHHRPDFVASAPVTIHAAAAAKPKNIRQSTAVTVLRSDAPIRVWQ